MTPSARVQAAIDLLDEILVSARAGGAAADTLIVRYFKTRRYAGSGDRRAIRELVYTAIRRAGEPPLSGRAAMLGLVVDRPDLAAAFDGAPHAPAAIGPKEVASPAGAAPAWLVKRFEASDLDGAEQAALLSRAPLDLRVNRLKGDRETLLAALPDSVESPFAPDGIRMPEGSRIDDLPAYAEGLVEVQDEGSQLVGAAARVQPGMTVIDLCAGAGGKSLALAAAMGNAGRLIACDVDRGRLSRLAPRAARAGVTIVEERLLDGGREAAALCDLIGQADVVLVDAPCSGTGTWRRNPEARWRLTPARIDRLIALQAQIADLAATLVKSGGTLTYIVCSLLDEEGAGQVASFLDRHPGWKVDPVVLPAGRQRGPGLRLTPQHDNMDGFFVARLRAP